MCFLAIGLRGTERASEGPREPQTHKDIAMGVCIINRSVKEGDDWYCRNYMNCTALNLADQSPLGLSSRQPLSVFDILSIVRRPLVPPPQWEKSLL